MSRTKFYQSLLKLNLIDSGADLSIFTFECADYLYLDLEKGAKLVFAGIGGSPIEAFVHFINLEISGEQICMPIAFSRNLRFRFNLLG